ncbi:MAG: hypothetical protein CVV24_11265 [Ignavibacteriae bacterium HGW-Ignavibacteriae-3]|nr:MAG: hypothetical protein CVV24_11265 [Ignavibacteriae bacterium HGW-Ignavibacteriae-3]
MKRQKFTHNKEKAISSSIKFCAECGEELDMFGIDNGEIDIEKVQTRHKHCKENGKFKGDLCAMMFIADPDEPVPPNDGDD